MSVPVLGRSVVFLGNGATVAFSSQFYFLRATDLLVYLVTSGLPVLQVNTVDYSVTLPASPGAAGTVTMTVAPPASTQLYITRMAPVTQVTSFLAQGAFLPLLHENSFDQLAMDVQQASPERAAYNVSSYLLPELTLASSGGVVSAPFTLTLPPPGSVNPGQVVTVLDEAGVAGTYNITVTGYGASATIATNYGSAQFMSSGTSWFLINATGGISVASYSSQVLWAVTVATGDGNNIYFDAAGGKSATPGPGIDYGAYAGLLVGTYFGGAGSLAGGAAYQAAIQLMIDGTETVSGVLCGAATPQTLVTRNQSIGIMRGGVEVSGDAAGQGGMGLWAYFNRPFKFVRILGLQTGGGGSTWAGTVTLIGIK